MHDEVFTIPARRCKRCGGLLTSSQGLRDGYGPCCLRKIKQEEADRKMMESQCSLFDMGATAPPVPLTAICGAAGSGKGNN